MKINWNGFLEKAIEAYPEERAAFLFTTKPYGGQAEKWVVMPVINIHENPEDGWIPDKKDMARIKAEAIKKGMTKIGNIHTHPYHKEFENDNVPFIDVISPSPKDLKFARRFNDIVRGILLVGEGKILDTFWHDKFGKKIPILVENE